MHVWFKSYRVLINTSWLFILFLWMSDYSHYQSLLPYILWELAGGGLMAVALDDSDMWPVTLDETCDTWHLTHDTLHMTPDTWHLSYKVNFFNLSKTQQKCKIPLFQIYFRIFFFFQIFFFKSEICNPNPRPTTLPSYLTY